MSFAQLRSSLSNFVSMRQSGNMLFCTEMLTPKYLWQGKLNWIEYVEMLRKFKIDSAVNWIFKIAKLVDTVR